ncbi:hypothetical protein FS837_001537 [Tulasnella sp. UAMH 9824]|nr:hypothetical protein FS837_001537 [Tulasnella sp. UAMH 9824]
MKFIVSKIAVLSVLYREKSTLQTRRPSSFRFAAAQPHSPSLKYGFFPSSTMTILSPRDSHERPPLKGKLSGTFRNLVRRQTSSSMTSSSVSSGIQSPVPLSPPLLPTSPTPPIEFLSFSGPGDDVLAFVQSVQRIAFTQNRQRDDAWIADFVSTCLSGSALVWYSTALDKTTQWDWCELRRAMIQRYLPSDENPLVPASAAASPPPASAIVSPLRLEPSDPLQTRRGRVKVIDATSNRVLGFIRRDKMAVMQYNMANALIVEYSMPDDDQKTQLKMLNLDTTARRTEFWNTAGNSTYVEASSSEWSINASNGEIEFLATWPDDDGQMRPVTFVCSHSVNSAVEQRERSGARTSEPDLPQVLVGVLDPSSTDVKTVVRLILDRS